MNFATIATMKMGALIFLFGLSLYFPSVVLSSSLEDLQVLFLKQDYIQAQKLAQSLLSKETDKNKLNEARYYLGLSYLYLKQYPQAIEQFNRLDNERLDPNFKDKVYLGLFDASFLNNDYKEAIDVLNRLLRKNPKTEYMSLVYLKMARANMKLTNWTKAHDLLEKIVTEFPQSLEVPMAAQLLEEKQYFAVQVGSFRERKLAEELAAELNQKGEYAYIVEITDPQSGRFFRVRVGQMAQLSEAQQLMSKLSQLGYPTQIYP